MKLDLSICRADEAVELVKQAALNGVPFDAVISIEHPGSEKLSTYYGRAPRLAAEIGPTWAHNQLILSCYDVEHPHFGYPTPPEYIVTDALAFIDSYSSLGRPLRLLMHCRSGKARSTALGLIAMLYTDGTPNSVEEYLPVLLRIRSVAAPNIAIIEHGDRILGFGGRLIAAIENHPGLTEARAESERRRIHQVESNKTATVLAL